VNSHFASTSQRIATDTYIYEAPTTTTRYTVFCMGYANSGTSPLSTEQSVTVRVVNDLYAQKGAGSYRITSHQGVEEWSGSATQYETVQKCKLVYLKSVRAGVTPTGTCIWNNSPIELSRVVNW
jgi:hypothetical protein